jgi:hypothetical protein
MGGRRCGRSPSFVSILEGKQGFLRFPSFVDSDVLLLLPASTVPRFALLVSSLRRAQMLSALRLLLSFNCVDFPDVLREKDDAGGIKGQGHGRHREGKRSGRRGRIVPFTHGGDEEKNDVKGTL